MFITETHLSALSKGVFEGKNSAYPHFSHSYFCGSPSTVQNINAQSIYSKEREKGQRKRKWEREKEKETLKCIYV